MNPKTLLESSQVKLLFVCLLVYAQCLVFCFFLQVAKSENVNVDHAIEINVVSIVG